MGAHFCLPFLLWLPCSAVTQPWHFLRFYGKTILVSGHQGARGPRGGSIISTAFIAWQGCELLSRLGLLPAAEQHGAATSKPTWGQLVQQAEHTGANTTAGGLASMRGDTGAKLQRFASREQATERDYTACGATSLHSSSSQGRGGTGSGGTHRLHGIYTLEPPSWEKKRALSQGLHIIQSRLAGSPSRRPAGLSARLSLAHAERAA